MERQQLLEKSAIAVSAIVLVAAAWFWIGQLNDVLDFLKVIAEAEG